MPERVETYTPTQRLIHLWAREVITRFRTEHNPNHTRAPAEQSVLDAEGSELQHPRNEGRPDRSN